MMKTQVLTLSVVVAIGVVGCSKSTGTGDAAATSAAQTTTSTGDASQAGAKLEGPAAVTYEFLEAVRTGNDEKAKSLLSAAAREKMASLNRRVMPAASDTATFAVGKVEYINDDAARVSCTWTDVDENQQSVTDPAVWGLRRENDSWRVCAVACPLFEGEKLLTLNFEDPEDMLRQQQWAEEETRKRMAASETQAPTGETQAPTTEARKIDTPLK